MSWNSRTNRIPIKWVNHNGWIDIFVVKKKYFLCSDFRHISLCFYSNFDRESSLDVEFDFASNEYPHCILLTFPATPKTRNTWKNVMMTSSSLFLGISCFGGRWVCHKYSKWVLIGFKIKFHIQLALSIEMWVKTQGDMSKIQTKKIVFFFSSSKINKYYFIILTIFLLFSLGGPF